MNEYELVDNVFSFTGNIEDMTELFEFLENKRYLFFLNIVKGSENILPIQKVGDNLLAQYYCESYGRINQENILTLSTKFHSITFKQESISDLENIMYSIECKNGKINASLEMPLMPDDVDYTEFDGFDDDISIHNIYTPSLSNLRAKR
jgi:hypothetical protein